jgi:hypothetical protein
MTKEDLQKVENEMAALNTDSERLDYWKEWKEKHFDKVLDLPRTQRKEHLFELLGDDNQQIKTIDPRLRVHAIDGLLFMTLAMIPERFFIKFFNHWQKSAEISYWFLVYNTNQEYKRYLEKLKNRFFNYDSLPVSEIRALINEINDLEEKSNDLVEKGIIKPSISNASHKDNNNYFHEVELQRVKLGYYKKKPLGSLDPSDLAVTYSVKLKVKNYLINILSLHNDDIMREIFDKMNKDPEFRKKGYDAIEVYNALINNKNPELKKVFFEQIRKSMKNPKWIQNLLISGLKDKFDEKEKLAYLQKMYCYSEHFGEPSMFLQSIEEIINDPNTLTTDTLTLKNFIKKHNLSITNREIKIEKSFTDSQIIKLHTELRDDFINTDLQNLKNLFNGKSFKPLIWTYKNNTGKPNQRAIYAFIDAVFESKTPKVLARKILVDENNKPIELGKPVREEYYNNFLEEFKKMLL